MTEASAVHTVSMTRSCVPLDGFVVQTKPHCSVASLVQVSDRCAMALYNDDAMAEVEDCCYCLEPLPCAHGVYIFECCALQMHAACVFVQGYDVGRCPKCRTLPDERQAVAQSRQKVRALLLARSLRKGLGRFVIHDMETGLEVAIKRLSMRIYPETTVEWLMSYVAKALSWPISHVQLTVGSTSVKYIHRIKERSRTRLVTFLDEKQPLVIRATRLERPKRMEDGLCLCDFGGCCVLCRVPGRRECKGCGNNGCCRSGNCGHRCCERNVKRPRLADTYCQFKGCAPAWAHDDDGMLGYLSD